jgi:hypothetical protein
MPTRLLAVALLACLALQAAANETRRFRSAAYDITTDLPQEQAKEVADHMDAVYQEYSRRFAAYGKRNAEPLRLWVFATREGYLEFLAGHDINGFGTGGMFFRRDDASGLVSFLGNRSLEDMLETLRHEGMHQVAYQRIGDTLPVWLNEGMAEWFGYAIPSRRGFVMGLADPRAVARLQAASERNSLLPLADLLRMEQADWNQRVQTGQAGSNYDQAWSVVHFLANAEGGRHQNILSTLLHAYWSGKNHDQAIKAAFGTDLAPMESAWKAYVASLRADELYEAQDIIGVYRVLLEALDEAGSQPADAAELDAALAAHADRLVLPETVPVINGERPLAIDAQAWWRTPPVSARTGRPAVIRFIPDRRGRLPAGVEIRGLNHLVSLGWSRDRDGVLSHRIIID